MTSVKLENVLTALDQIAAVAPTIAAASGLTAAPLLTEIATSIPEIHTMLNTLLALFQKHAAVISNSSTATVPATPSSLTAA